MTRKIFYCLFIAFLIVFSFIAGCSSSSQSKVIPTTPIPTPSVSITLTPKVTITTPPSTTITPTTTIPPTVKFTTVTTTKTYTPFPTTSPIQTTIEVNQISGICSCISDNLNCGDFTTQKSAQECFDYCKSLGKGDIYKLDADKNGVACESNK